MRFKQLMDEKRLTTEEMAKAINSTTKQVATYRSKNPEILELKDGRFVIISSMTRYVSLDSIK